MDFRIIGKAFDWLLRWFWGSVIVAIAVVIVIIGVYLLQTGCIVEGDFVLVKYDPPSAAVETVVEIPAAEPETQVEITP